MAGVTTLSYRMFLKSLGVRFFITEMVSAKGMHYRSRNTFLLMKTVPEAHDGCITGLQIFGSEPDIMREVTEKYLNDTAYDFIDINMGCPMKKVVNNGDGSALLKDPEKVYRVTKAVSESSVKPVTVKTRLGYDESNVDELTQAMEEGGAEMISVHARTRAQVYSGKADHEKVRSVCENRSVPVVANGDITDIKSAAEVLETTKAAGLMIGRGENYNPFLIPDINEWLDGKNPHMHGIEEKIRAMRTHFDVHMKYSDPKKAIKEFRKYLYWYIKGMRNSARIRSEINRIETPDEIFRLFDTIEKIVEEDR